MPSHARVRRAALRRMAPALVVLALYGVVALICNGIPLLDVLAYEPAFLFALIGSFASILLTVVLVHRWRRLRTDPLEGPVSPSGVILALYGRALGVSLLLLALPLDILAANAVSVRNCNFLEGVAWFVLLPGLSAAVACAWGVLLGLLPVRRRFALLAGVLVPVGSLGLGFWRFYSQPPVSQYDPFAGFFSGSLYDDHIAITGTFLAARIYHLSGAAVVLLLAARFFVPGERRLALRPREPRRRLSAALAGAAVICAGLYLAGGRLAYSVDGDDIARELGGLRRTPHFLIHYPTGSETAVDIGWHAVEAEFRHDQLRRFFGTAPADRIRIFLFRDSAEKRRWYGADRVDMAKPWRLETYLTQREFPHPVLRHELAHAFAAVFGDRAFGVSLRWERVLGVLPVPTFNPGLVEGAAVAADWRARGGLTPHQWAQAMVKLGKAPPLAAVMGYGFFGSASSLSYTVAGSFSRFLVERYGAEAFRAAYRSGGDFRRAYGRSLAELEGQWRRFLEGVPVGPRELALARERFRQRPIFQRPCPHEVARLERRAGEELGRGQADEAARTFGELCRLDPGDPDHLFGLLVSRLRAGREEPALAAARRLWHHPATTPPLLAQVFRVLGNDAWRRGERRRADRLFAAAEALAVPEDLARDLAVRRMALADPALDAGLRPLLAPRDDEDPGEGPWSALGRRLPDRAIVRYLVGSHHLAEGEWEAAAAHLARALALGLPDERFAREARFRLGRAELRAQRFGAARATFARLDVAEQAEAVRLEARDWIERCDFFARHGASLGLPPPPRRTPPGGE